MSSFQAFAKQDRWQAGWTQITQWSTHCSDGWMDRWLDIWLNMADYTNQYFTHIYKSWHIVECHFFTENNENINGEFKKKEENSGLQWLWQQYGKGRVKPVWLQTLSPLACSEEEVEDYTVSLVQLRLMVWPSLSWQALHSLCWVECGNLVCKQSSKISGFMLVLFIIKLV